MYAIIETGGKQYKVSKGDTIYVEKLDADKGGKVKFDKVVFVSGSTPKIGTPLVKGASVEGKVIKNGKGKKISIFRYKPKKGAQSKKGHRQPYTAVEITKVSATATSKPAAKKAATSKTSSAKKSAAKTATAKK